MESHEQQAATARAYQDEKDVGGGCMMTTEKESEFGQGLCYCLGLFLAHAERLKSHIEDYEKQRKRTDCPPNIFNEGSAVQMWFYGASDHLYELIPDSAPEHLIKRVVYLRNKCFDWRLPMEKKHEPTKKDAMWAIQECKDLLREIDAHHGVPVIKGSWE